MLQVVRYEPGQFYLQHHDFTSVNSPNNRFVTLLVYLSSQGTDFEGGSTSFPLLNASVKPKKGSAAFWHNCRRVGTDVRCFANTLHQGDPVTAGAKAALNIWIRFTRDDPLDEE